MSLIYLSLLSLIIILVAESLVANKFLLRLISMLPAGTYMFLNYEKYSQSLVIAVAFLFVYLIFIQVREKKHLSPYYITGLMWFIIFFQESTTVMEIAGNLICLYAISLFMQDKSVIRDYKVYESISAKSIILIFIAYLFSFIGGVSSNELELVYLRELMAENKVQHNLIFIFYLYALGAMGSFSFNERFDQISNDIHKKIFSFVQYFVYPLILTSLLKRLMIDNFLESESMFYQISLFVLTINYLLRLKERNFSASGHVLISFNTVSISMLALLTEEFTLYYLSISLLINFIFFYLIEYKKIATKALKLLYIGIPLSPIFLLKAHFIYLSMLDTNFVSLVIILGFFFMPAIIAPMLVISRGDDAKV